LAKPIILSGHARVQCHHRHADPAEVADAIRTSPWEPAKSGRYRVRKSMAFGKPSPVTGNLYRWRAVEAIFAEEAARLVVVTVIVKYWN